VRSTRWRAEAALVVVAAVFILVAGSGAIWYMSRQPVHVDAAAVPSTAAAAPIERYAAPVEESRRRARELVAADNLPGLSVAVAVDGEIVWAEGFGWADLENRTPVTPLTRFRLGALSKPLTAVGAALLHDRGRLDLDAPVQRYVPAYPRKQWPITARQLMGDVAGVHRIRGDNNDAMPTAHCESLDEAVALLADEPLLFEPGTQHRYSIWGWVLGRDRTVVAETEGLYGIGHGAERPPDYSCVAGGGAFLSTPTDLVRFGSATLKPGLLRAETIDAFRTPTRLVSGASTAYALGWTVKNVQLAGKPARIVSHRGSPAGGTVSLLTFPDLGLAIAAAANVSDATGVDPFALRVAEVFTTGRRGQALGAGK
jgi:CubicO group peptidase (beta-lactamase class C family)